MPNVLAAIAAFGAMIFFHELGHFLLAKRAGVRVHAFALGFGPQVLGWKRGETTYSLNLLPFGGFVKMEGEDDGQSGEGSFRSKSVGARMGIIVAGPAMNLLLAVAILSLMAGTIGVPIGASTRVGTVESGWPAEAAGLRPEDVIVAIDGVAMTSGEQVIGIIHKSAGKTLELTVRRGDQTLTMTVTPRHDEKRGVGRIGFSPEQLISRLGPVQAVGWGLESTVQFVVRLWGAIGVLIREGRFMENLGGPVLAGSELAKAAATSAVTYLYMAASLSIVIGVFNLLPIPALDGGRLAFLALEAVRGRPLDPRREGLIHTVGFAFLLLLIVGLTARDILRLLGLRG